MKKRIVTLRSIKHIFILVFLFSPLYVVPVLAQEIDTRIETPSNSILELDLLQGTGNEAIDEEISPIQSQQNQHSPLNKYKKS